MHGLSCLLLTRDSQLESVVRPALEQAEVAVELTSNSDQALQVVERQHLDGFMLDCAEVPGAEGVMQSVRGGRVSSRGAILAVVEGGNSAQAAIQRGANLVLRKPISTQELHSYLDIALVFLNREFRRYFRHKIELPVQLGAGSSERTATMFNISEGGLGVRLAHPENLNGKLAIRFKLPAFNNPVIDAQGEVVWIRNSGEAGIKFVDMPTDSMDYFHDWLLQLGSLRRRR